MSRIFVLYIKDMLENMEDAEEFIAGMEYEEFVIDKRTNRAVLRCIEIMGEAAKHVPDHIRLRFSKIPWRDIAGMRDKVIHFYFGVSLEKVWLAMKEDIPILIPLVKDVLEKLQCEEKSN